MAAAIGQTFPNPCVGCVIVNNGQVVGEGFHRKSGEAHAEVLALRMAGDLARGGRGYVFNTGLATLIPVLHFV